MSVTPQNVSHWFQNRRRKDTHPEIEEKRVKRSQTRTRRNKSSPLDLTQPQRSQQTTTPQDDSDDEPGLCIAEQAHSDTENDPIHHPLQLYWRKHNYCSTHTKKKNVPSISCKEVFSAQIQIFSFFFFVIKQCIFFLLWREICMVTTVWKHKKRKSRRKKIIIKSFSFLGKCAEGETNMCVWLNNNAASATRETRKCKFFFFRRD